MTNSSYIKCKTLLFDRKSIRQEKDRGKGKSRAEGRGGRQGLSPEFVNPVDNVPSAYKR